jgi:nitrite reductase (cytochrome c-552)
MGNEHKGRKFSIAVAVIVGAMAALVVAGLLTNVAEKKGEARNSFLRVVDITDETVDPAVWGKNFPAQYDGYLKTTDQTRTHFGGSEALPHDPTSADPRATIARSKIEEDPRLKTIWAGYAFSKDYRERRGHAYMLDDQTYTGRQSAKTMGVCINCHASLYATYKKLGGGDLTKGFEMLNLMPYVEARKLVTHPIACIDCHDPATMQLRVTRPAFMEGIRAYKKSVGIQDYDVNKMATHQEMRSYVCGQCHVEYYFKGDQKRLVYPWDKGLNADSILAYYDEIKFKDWDHADTGAPLLKAQHPEFEMWNQGVHARSGVTCADCHMPYMRQGAAKISDHHVRSPMLNINRACQTCHKWPEAELLDRVNLIQQRTDQLKDLGLDALVELIADIKNGMATKAPEAKLAKARDFQRKAQFLLDFVMAENSTGFHAPQESARLLGEALDYCRKGQNSLR